MSTTCRHRHPVEAAKIARVGWWGKRRRAEEGLREQRTQTRLSRSNAVAAWLAVLLALVAIVTTVVVYQASRVPDLALEVIAFVVVTEPTTILESNAADETTTERSRPATTLDVTLKNDGATVAVVTGLDILISRAGQLKECQGGAGALSATGDYDIELPDASEISRLPHVLRFQLRREVGPKAADRFRLHLGPTGQLYTNFANVYAVGFSASVFGRSSPFPLGAAVVSDTPPDPGRFLAGESEGDVTCVARNKASILGVVSAPGERLDELIAVRRLAELAEPMAPWPVECGGSRDVPKKAGSSRRDITSDGLPEVAIMLRCANPGGRERDHVVAYVGATSPQELRPQRVSPAEGIIASGVSWEGNNLIVMGRTVSAIDVIATSRWTWKDGAFVELDTTSRACEETTNYRCVGN